MSSDLRGDRRLRWRLGESTSSSVSPRVLRVLCISPVAAGLVAIGFPTVRLNGTLGATTGGGFVSSACRNAARAGMAAIM